MITDHTLERMRLPRFGSAVCSIGIRAHLSSASAVLDTQSAVLANATGSAAADNFLLPPHRIFHEGAFYVKMAGMSELDTAVFFASIPPIMTGIKTGGDGMRVQFDIPETEMSEGAKLLGMRGKRLRVTVEVLNAKDDARFG